MESREPLVVARVSATRRFRPARSVVSREHRDRSRVHDRQLSVRFGGAVVRVTAAPISPGVADDAFVHVRLNRLRRVLPV